LSKRNSCVQDSQGLCVDINAWNVTAAALQQEKVQIPEFFKPFVKNSNILSGALACYMLAYYTRYY
jgi:hypothetical protein